MPTALARGPRPRLDPAQFRRIPRRVAWSRVSRPSPPDVPPARCCPGCPAAPAGADLAAV